MHQRPLRPSRPRPRAHLPPLLLHPRPAPTRTRAPYQGPRSLGLAPPSSPQRCLGGAGATGQPPGGLALEGTEGRRPDPRRRTPGAESRFGTPHLPTPFPELLGGDSTQVAAWTSPRAHACVSLMWGTFTQAGLLGSSPSLCPEKAAISVQWGSAVGRPRHQAGHFPVWPVVSLLLLGELIYATGINCEPGLANRYSPPR